MQGWRVLSCACGWWVQAAVTGLISMKGALMPASLPLSISVWNQGRVQKLFPGSFLPYTSLLMPWGRRAEQIQQGKKLVKSTHTPNQHQTVMIPMSLCKIQHFSGHLPNKQTYFALHFPIKCQEVLDRNLNPHMILPAERHFTRPSCS